MKEKPQRPHICTITSQADIRYVQDALYVLSGKWRLPIIIALYNGIHTYRSIQQSYRASRSRCCRAS